MTRRPGSAGAGAFLTVGEAYDPTGPAHREGACFLWNGDDAELALFIPTPTTAQLGAEPCGRLGGSPVR